MRKFESIIKMPNRVIGATEKTPYRFEERECDAENEVKYEIRVENGCVKVIVYPSGSPVKYLKLRFHAELDFVDRVLGDTWARCGSATSNGSASYLQWTSKSPSKPMPWYFIAGGEGNFAGWGVKTGANAFALFNLDSRGITLFLDLTSGTSGTDLKEPIVACEIVEYIGEEGERAFSVSRKLCQKMCESPVKLKEPIFGTNNWYFAYGKISEESIYEEADYLLKMTRGTRHSPYLIIDDGWQRDRTYDQPVYIGGPWVPNERFPNMRRMTDKLHSMGIKTGIWFRPLLTHDKIDTDMILYENKLSGGYVMDPSHPKVIEKIREDVRTLTNYGFDLIKFDFSLIDIMNAAVIDILRSVDFFSEERKFYDNSKTTATIIKNFYQAIQDAAGDRIVIGCNTMGHLIAGISAVQRTGNDTSGRSFEWTVRNGVNTAMRLPQNRVFFETDPDCAAFTHRVDEKMNLDFLEMCALTGQTTLASVTPGILSEEGMRRINEIFKIADTREDFYEVMDFEKTSSPEEFVLNGEVKKYNWTDEYDGSRQVLNWLN